MQIVGKRVRVSTKGLNANIRKKLFGTVFVAPFVALITLLLGVSSFQNYQSLRDHGIITEGIVLNSREGAGHSSPLESKFEFQVDGKVYRYWTDRYEGDVLEIGDRMDLLVDSTTPSRFQADNGGVDKIDAIILWSVSGTAFTVALGALLALVVDSKKRKERRGSIRSKTVRATKKH